MYYPRTFFAGLSKTTTNLIHPNWSKSQGLNPSIPKTDQARKAFERNVRVLVTP